MWGGGGRQQLSSSILRPHQAFSRWFHRDSSGENRTSGQVDFSEAVKSDRLVFKT